MQWLTQLMQRYPAITILVTFLNDKFYIILDDLVAGGAPFCSKTNNSFSFKPLLSLSTSLNKSCNFARDLM